MKNIMKLFLYAALPLALIALGSCSYPKNITFKADSQTGALSGLYLTSDTSMNWILRTDGTQYEWVDSRHLSMTIIRMPGLATKPVAMHIYGQEEMKPMSIAPG